MIRAIHRSADGRVTLGLAPSDFAAALQQDGGLLWVDLEGEPPEASDPILRETFGFHPLAISDALHETHVPKVDDWGKYLFIVLHAVRFHVRQEKGRHLDTLELDLFLGRNYVVTHHDHPIDAVNRVWEACVRDVSRLSRGADTLGYRLADEMVDDYMPVVERMEETIELTQNAVFRSSGPAVLDRIFALKRSLLRLHRIMVPQREVLNRLARGDFAVVDPEDRMQFRDVYDHLVRLADINENLRDLLSSVMDTYLSVTNNRMNDIMKTLTIITTLFMPMSFIVGFFGMNFFQPGAERLGVWTARPVFWVTIALLVLAPLGLYVWARRRGWVRRLQ